jgi:hypothetical protein
MSDTERDFIEQVVMAILAMLPESDARALLVLDLVKESRFSAVWPSEHEPSDAPQLVWP